MDQKISLHCSHKCSMLIDVQHGQSQGDLKEIERLHAFMLSGISSYCYDYLTKLILERILVDDTWTTGGGASVKLLDHWNRVKGMQPKQEQEKPKTTTELDFSAYTV